MPSRPRSASWIDRFHGHSQFSASKDIRDLQKWGGDLRGNDVYNAALGQLS
jgi:hypothetical protein